MKYEEVILEKHLFNDRVTQFLDLISRMNNREIEQALGRLLDYLEVAESDNEKAQVRIRGEILRSYYELRKAGIKKYRKPGFFRFVIPEDVKKIFPKRKFLEGIYTYRMRCATESILITKEAFEAINQVVDKPIPEQVKLLAP